MKGLLYAFLGGAVVGCAAAILFAPESGKDLRERIRRMLRNRGIDFTDDDIDALERWTASNGDALVCGVRDVA